MQGLTALSVPQRVLLCEQLGNHCCLCRHNAITRLPPSSNWISLHTEFAAASPGFSSKSVSRHCCLCINVISLLQQIPQHIGETNGNPLQYSCLGNPMDGGAWQLHPCGCKRVGHDLATEQLQLPLLHPPSSPHTHR